MTHTPSSLVALQKIRQKLYLCAALALRNNIDLSGELFRIFGDEAPLRQIPKHKIKILPAETLVKLPLTERQTLVMETIYEADEPVTINEMFAKFATKADTRCSLSSITTTVKFLRGIDLIGQANTECGKQGYTRPEDATNGTIIT